MANLGLEQDIYNSLVQASPLPAAIYTGDDRIIFAANNEMQALLAKDLEIVGKPMEGIMPTLEGKSFPELLQQVFSSGCPYQAKEDKALLLINQEPKIVYWSYTLKPLVNQAGHVHAVIHTVVDVTNLVTAREQISQMQESLFFALSSAEIGTWDLDPIKKIVRWDSRCQELFGFPENDLVSYQDTLTCIHPMDLERVVGAVAAAIAPCTKGKYEIRYRTIRKSDRQIRWVLCKGKAYFNAENIAYRFAGTAQDITQEVKMRLREQQLLTLVNHNIDHMSVADMDGNLIYMNLAARKLLGVAADEDVTTLKANDFYSEKELARVQQTLIKQISAANGWQGVIMLMNRQTKEEIPCQVNYILIKDEETGEIIGRGATARDLRLEIKAKADLQRLATIVDISGDFCNYCDLEGNTIYLNNAGINLIGITKDEVAHTNLYNYHSEPSAKAIKEIILPELLREGRWTGSLELLHQQTGELIPIHKQLFIIREDITNQPVAIAGIARDMRPEINARKAFNFKNAQLQIAVKELEFLANSVPAVVWTSKPDGKLDYISQRWYEKAPVSIDMALGSGWAETLHPDDEQRAWIAWRECLKTGNPYQIEFRLKDKDEQYRWWLVQAIALKDDAGQIIKWYGSNTDITDHKELERQKDNFLGVASHELKTPVTSIKAYAQVLEMKFRRAGDLKNASLLSKMDNQLNRLNNLIGDLLEVTKINTGRLEFNHRPFIFDDMVNEVIEDVQHTAIKHQIIKNLHCARQVTGDKERIYQVVTNMLTNAIKYSPDAERVLVFTEDHGEEVKFCVQDFGIGINEYQKDKVFEQFYRVSGNKEHTFPGLGLGLYISAEIIKHLHGKIWVESVEGEGSTFCFLLPKQHKEEVTEP
jgi:PAS domain S-box-containing protein